MVAHDAEGGEEAEQDCVILLYSLERQRAQWYIHVMALRSTPLPSDPALLTELALALEAENETLKTTIVTLKALIFGARSERLSRLGAEQLALDLSENRDEEPRKTAATNDDIGVRGSREEAVQKGRAQHRDAAQAPSPLRAVIEPTTTQCPVLQRTNASHRRGCERDARPCSGRAARLAHDPSQICVPGLRKRGRAGAGAGAADRRRHGLDGARRHIAVAKYGWHSTLYRQSAILAGQGVDLDRQTLARWMKQAAWMLKGLYDLQLETMHRYPRLFCDETPMPVLAPGHVEASASSGRMRPMTAPGRDRRRRPSPMCSRTAAARRRSRRTCRLYRNLAGRRLRRLQGAGQGRGRQGRITLAFCLAHARRKFVAVFKTTNSPFAKEVIETIAMVYAIEKRIRGKSADERRAVRQAETKPIMEALHARLIAVRDGLSQISPLIKAINYTLAHWSGLTRFLDDGRIEPDTNTVERPMRPIAIGKRNSLFAGDNGGAETWAILSTLISTRRRLNGVDPETWLADVLERMVSGRTNNRLAELLVWNWKAARGQAEIGGLIRHQRNRLGSLAVSASRVSEQIDSLISRSVVCSK